jgi:hypothetical protein
MVNALTPLVPPPASIAGLMMNKSLRARAEESSRKTFYGFQLLVIPGRGSSARARNPDTVHGAEFRVHAKTRVLE